MARKRKSTHRRRKSHRVGAVNVKKVGMKVVGVAVGAFAARTINNMVTKQMPTLSATMIGAGDVVVGVLIPKFIKSDLGAAIGDGFVAIGSLTALQSLGVLSGMGALPARVPVRVIGARQGNFLSKTVGATPRPFIRKTVGATGSAYNMMETMNRQAVGACGIGSLMAEE